MQVSSDMSIIDFDIPYSMIFALAGWIELLTTIVILAIVTWQVVIVAIPVMISVVYIQVKTKIFIQNNEPTSI